MYIRHSLDRLPAYQVRFEGDFTMKRRAITCSLPLALLLVGGCATTVREPVSEKLDPDTATTVTILSQPIELLADAHRNKDTDPFAYIAPFETNRMGVRDLFLWVSTPQASGQLTQPQVLCNGQPLNLQPVSQEDTAIASHAAPGDNVTSGGAPGSAVKVDLSKLALSRAPYEAPVPWSTQWYFRLPAESLKCLADADGITLEARAADGNQEEFTASGRKNLASLDAFTRR
jgi:hypothetical protein